MPNQSKLEQVRALRENGYVVVPGLLTPERSEAMLSVAPMGGPRLSHGASVTK